MHHRCINCGLKLLKVKYYLSFAIKNLEENVQQLLSEWISPRVLSQEHVVCTECMNLVTSSESGTPQQLGHQLVCISCGISVISKRNCPLVKESSKNREIFKKWAGEYLGPHLTTACCSCKRRAGRRSGPEEPFNSRPLKASSSRPLDDSSSRPLAKLEFDEVDERQCKPSNILVLANHRRLESCTGSGSGECAVGGCGRRGAAATLAQRQRLVARRLYVPPGAPLCTEHGDDSSSDWQAATTDGFTSDHVADMLFLMKQYPAVDFAHMEAVDRSLAMIWLGVTYKQFTDILHQTPALARVEDSHLLLAVYLARRRTAENCLVLASLFQMSSDELEAKLQLATDCMELSAEATGIIAEDVKLP